MGMAEHVRAYPGRRSTLAAGGQVARDMLNLHVVSKAVPTNPRAVNRGGWPAKISRL